MRIDAKLPISKIADEIPGARQVFETLGIDYACAGERTLTDAAHEEGLDPELLVASLRRLLPAGAARSWSDRPLTELVHFLTNEHHKLVREELARIALGMFELCAPPATPQADLQSLRATLVCLSETLLPHMHEEEDSLFGPIEALELAWQTNGRSTDGVLRSHISHIVTEHGTIATQLRTIRDLRLRLEAANEMPSQCRTTLGEVARLEAHLHEYMFLENCVLFPRAVALAEQMSAV
jgi:regulator of cell morphogenesis and NO signaling